MTNTIYEISGKYLNLSSIDYIGEVYKQPKYVPNPSIVPRSEITYDFRFEVILRGQSREMIFKTEDEAKSERDRLVIAWKQVIRYGHMLQ